MKRFDLQRLETASKACGAVLLGLALSACSWQEVKETFSFSEDVNNVSDVGGVSGDAAEIVRMGLPASIIVCRSKQCAPSTANMSKEFLYNAYYSLMENNVGTNILLCSADSVSHVCYEPFMNFELNAGITPATVAIDAARIIDIGLQKDNKMIVPVLDYSIYTNGVRARCNPSSAFANVKSPSYMVIDSEQAACQFTASGSSSMSIVFTVDYIDLDYGIIGAYYSAGVSGSSYGGGKGYALLRFEKPVNPDIYCQQKNASCAPFKPKLPEYNCCGGFGKGRMPRNCDGAPCGQHIDYNAAFENDRRAGGFRTETRTYRSTRRFDGVVSNRNSAAYTSTGRNIRYTDANEDRDLVTISPVPSN